MKIKTYNSYRQSKFWQENTLERSDENITGNFEWHLVGRFGPYLARHKSATIGSIVLMLLYTAFNLANPYLIGVAIDKFIGHNDLRGLTIIGVILLVVNIGMWQAQYWQGWVMSLAGQPKIHPLQFHMLLR